jgi:hypothetical protein
MLSAALTDSIPTAAALAAAGRVVVGAVPAKVSALAQEVLRTMFMTKLKIVAVSLLTLTTCGAGVMAFRAWAAEPEVGKHEAAPKPKEDQRKGLSDPSAEKQATEDSKIRKLLKERIATLKEMVREMEASKAVGRTGSDGVLKARIEVLRAELELAESQKERIAIHEKIVALAMEFEILAQESFKAQTLSTVDLLRAKANRLEAEIALERSKDMTQK